MYSADTLSSIYLFFSSNVQTDRIRATCGLPTSLWDSSSIISAVYLNRLCSQSAFDSQVISQIQLSQDDCLPRSHVKWKQQFVALMHQRAGLPTIAKRSHNHTEDESRITSAEQEGFQKAEMTEKLYLKTILYQDYMPMQVKLLRTGDLIPCHSPENKFVFVIFFFIKSTGKQGNGEQKSEVLGYLSTSKSSVSSEWKLILDSRHTHLEELVHPQPVDAGPLSLQGLQEALQEQKLCREEHRRNHYGENVQGWFYWIAWW